jgi:two-component system NtrC family sensor kinase
MINLNCYHILLIDDDEDDYVNLKALFEEIPRIKYDITWKSTYDSGLKALNEEQYDVCLLDYRLGEKNGIDLLKETKGLEKNCPVIFLTGQGDFELDVRAMQVGAAEFLIKAHLTAPLLERSIRYTMKHAMDLRELRESRAQIIQQDRLASLGLLASSLAHEIGTPLGVIRSRAQLMEKKFKLQPEVKQGMETIITQIDRIAELVNSLLNLAREKKSDYTNFVSLDPVIKDVLNLMKHEFDRKGIDFVIKVEPHLKVKAEAGPLAQVLINLLVNAIHAIEEVKPVKNQLKKVVIESAEFPSFIELSIKDTGCGISRENMHQLFKPFFTTKEVGQGTGLGLATSIKLVQSWGGKLHVQSQLGEGSTFTLNLLK